MSSATCKPLRSGDSGLAPVAFSSSLPIRKRHALECLFFFNPRQLALAERIRDIVGQLGAPYIRQEGARIWLAVPSGAMQCLFACEPDSEPVGVTLFSRPAPDCLRICHLAVDPVRSGHQDDEPGVAAMLVGRVVQIGRSVQGVTRVQLPYRRNSFISIRRVI